MPTPHEHTILTMKCCMDVCSADYSFRLCWSAITMERRFTELVKRYQVQ